MESVSCGDIVLSKSGRDKGNLFLVCKVIDDNFVLLVDGKVRKVSSPKKKKLKHIKVLGKNFEVLKEKFENSKKVFDSEVFSVIKKFVIESEGGQK